jgi:AbrB family looped-hinge helix DNA binding protein
MKSVIGERGQVTIPKPLRRSLGLRPGEEVEFQEVQGKIVLSKAGRVDPWDAVVGILAPMDVDVALAAMRGPAWTAALDRPPGRPGKTGRAEKPTGKRVRP